MNMANDFISLCLQGKALLTDIDSHVAQWEGSEKEVSLTKYLGMTGEEFKFWDNRLQNLRIIVAARDQSKKIDELKANSEHVLYAPRSGGRGESGEVSDWLRVNGFID